MSLPYTVTDENAEAIHTLLAEAVAKQITFNLTVHVEDNDTMLDWLQRGLLSDIRQGAGEGKNPPTAHLLPPDATDDRYSLVTVFGCRPAKVAA